MTSKLLRGRSSRPVETNVGSKVLTIEENEMFFALLGAKCVTLASGVAQLFLTEPPYHEQWKRRFIGVVAFVKDFTKRSFFIRIYDIFTQQLLWEQELFKECPQPQLSKPFFVSLEAEDCIAGFCFSNEDEAQAFYAVIVEKLNRKKQQSRDSGGEDTGTTSPAASSTPNSTIYVPPNLLNTTSIAKDKNSDEMLSVGAVSTGDLHLKTIPVQGGAAELTYRQGIDSATKNKGRNQKKGSKAPLSKLDIGAPLAGSFEVRAHLGADSGFNFNDPACLELLQDLSATTGFKPKSNKQRQFIADFIQQNGGIERVRSEYCSVRGPDVPVHFKNDDSAAAAGNKKQAPPRPPVPGGQLSSTNLPPSPPKSAPLRPPPPSSAPAPPSGNIPPPPPLPPPSLPKGASSGPPPPPPLPNNSGPPPNKTNNSGPPVPPPPPPLPGSGGVAGKRQAPAVPKLSPGDSNIFQPPVAPPPPPTTKKEPASRDNLLSDIRKGIALKPVGSRKSNSSGGFESGDLKSAIKNAALKKPTSPTSPTDSIRSGNSPTQEKQHSAGPPESIADALKRALMQRQHLLADTDDESSDISSDFD